MRQAILVSTDYLSQLEHMAEELRQAATTEHPVNAKRHLQEALVLSLEVDCGVS